jgi:hypothetical protein
MSMYGTSPSGGASGDVVQAAPSESDSTRDVAAEEARGVAGDAKAAGQQTAATAKDQAAQVADEAKVQARQVYDQAKQELNEQVGSQHQRAASGIAALADELASMVQGSDQNGLVTDLAQQASDRAREVAHWLEARQPGEVLDEVRSFARRRPGAFLAAAAVAGLVGGRLTRGMTDQAREDRSESSTGSQFAATPSVTPPVTPVTPSVVSPSEAGGVPGGQPAYDQEPSGMPTMPVVGTPPLDDPLEGPLVTGTPGTGEPYGGEQR